MSCREKNIGDSKVRLEGEAETESDGSKGEQMYNVTSSKEGYNFKYTSSILVNKGTPGPGKKRRRLVVS